MNHLRVRSTVLAATVAIGLFIGSHLDAANDAPVHDRYVATIHCGYAVMSSVMRDDQDAIDGVLDRMADTFGSDWESACPNPTIAVVYLP